MADTSTSRVSFSDVEIKRQQREIERLQEQADRRLRPTVAALQRRRNQSRALGTTQAICGTILNAIALNGWTRSGGASRVRRAQPPGEEANLLVHHYGAEYLRLLSGEPPEDAGRPIKSIAAP